MMTIIFLLSWWHDGFIAFKFVNKASLDAMLQYTLKEYYNRPLFKLNFFCLNVIVSKCIESEIICMVMDFSLAIFWNICDALA